MIRFTRAFTLIELLAVIGVLALLIGLLMPALGKAQATARTVQCAATLKSLGAAWTLYVDEAADALPPAVSMPSPIAAAPPDELTIMRVLRAHVADPKAYACAGDDQDQFAQFGTSYEYLPGLAIALDPANARLLASVARVQPHIVPILSDAATFHDAPPDIANPNQTVYHDAHVDWLFDSIPPNPLED